MNEREIRRSWMDKTATKLFWILCWTVALSASGAFANNAMNFDKQSKIVILAGHSISRSGDSLKISRQDVTPINKHLDDIFQQLEHELAAFGTTAVYLTEGKLSRQLARQGLQQGDEASIIELMRLGGYTHLVAADVQPAVNTAFDVTILMAKFPPGLQLTELPEQRLTSSASKSDLEGVINAIVFDMAKFRDPSTPKIIEIACIEPMNSVVVDYTPQLQLERVLSKSITPKLIAFYHRPEMQAKYRSMVRSDTYDIHIEDRAIKCKRGNSTVKLVKTRVVDYWIGGKVAVVREEVGNIHSVKLIIEFVRTLPAPPCERNIPITKEFKPEMYHRQPEFSTNFSDGIWPEYELAWRDKVETCP
jgi:hypothetical protein